MRLLLLHHHHHSYPLLVAGRIDQGYLTTSKEVRYRSWSQDMDQIYTRLDDVQTEQQLLAGRLNMLFRDRRAHAYTLQVMEAEARMSREAWQRHAGDLTQPELPEEAGGSGWI
uniref:Uncharacterized protein n=1 Tax=Tanacetum cinerariifolium TaxID=118510 RepID=A0A699SJG0_TANCI|nr:hypothetical protein [Tanacetum cinerariifolium]